MDPTDLENSLAEIFGSQMSMAHDQEPLDLPSNEEEVQEEIPLTLLIKPFGFKPPPPKAIIPRLLQDWNIKKGVTITPKRYTDNIMVCLFKDQKDMLYVERDRAWSVQGAHLMIEPWDRRMSLEEITFDSITFWIHIRGIPPEMLSRKNITNWPKEQVSFNCSGSGTDLMEGSDSTPQINAPAGRYSKQEAKSPTVADPEKIAGTDASEDFLHGGMIRGNPAEKRNSRKPASPISLSTDTLYSGLIEMQA
ncbi:hypothetical protein CRG98_004811 [Punica granatum]|uniref:Uncharacterized protein n=1 Tax=Punica granatum TaxID=22663 RepID=A0A2I0L2E1_PUNGR|nr:hypothetical protein CRG98_004811 [Punica granatum]